MRISRQRWRGSNPCATRTNKAGPLDYCGLDGSKGCAAQERPREARNPNDEGSTNVAMNETKIRRRREASFVSCFELPSSFGFRTFALLSRRVRSTAGRSQATLLCISAPPTEGRSPEPRRAIVQGATHKIPQQADQSTACQQGPPSVMRQAGLHFLHGFQRGRAAFLHDGHPVCLRDGSESRQPGRRQGRPPPARNG